MARRLAVEHAEEERAPRAPEVGEHLPRQACARGEWPCAQARAQMHMHTQTWHVPRHVEMQGAHAHAACAHAGAGPKAPPRAPTCALARAMAAEMAARSASRSSCSSCSQESKKVTFGKA